MLSHWLNSLAWVGSALSLLLLCGCSTNDELEWTEDVRLPDGRVVAVKRWVEFKAPAAMGSTPNESRQTLEFKHPDTGQVVKWSNNKDEGYLKTIALWIGQGKPRLLLRPGLMEDFLRLQCPNPPYLLKEHDGVQWQSVPVSAIGLKQLRSNLTESPKGTRERIEGQKNRLSADQTSDTFVTIETKRSTNYRVPYVMIFDPAQLQTFDEKNCDKKFNMLVDEGALK